MKIDYKDYVNIVNEMNISDKRLMNTLHFWAVTKTALKIDIQRGVLKPVGIETYVDRKDLSSYVNGFCILPQAEYIKLKPR